MAAGGMELDQELYDYLLAVSLQQAETEEAENVAPPPPRNKAAPETGPRRSAEGKTLSPVDPSWELIDPTPNIHALFIEFDREYFFASLGSVCVSWSSRMTLCAGICSYSKHSSCQIRLSMPLLKLRPRKDLVETLLHEMIHAYLFLHSNERESHGPLFHKHMRRINAQIGSNITVYHTFDQEVSVYKRHWWRCNGPCQHRKPFFGFVKRAMNRAPGKNDTWWASHQASCGGTFIKVREPKDETKKTPEAVKNHGGDIRSFLPPQEGAGPAKVARVEAKEPAGKPASIPDPEARFPGKGQTLGGGSERRHLLEPCASRSVAAEPAAAPKPALRPSAAAAAAAAARAPPAAPKPALRPSAAAAAAAAVRAPPAAPKPSLRPSAAAAAAARAPPAAPKPALRPSAAAAAARAPPAAPKPPQKPLTSPPRQSDIRRFLGTPAAPEPAVTCPCCSTDVPAGRINEHLDACLS